MLIARIGRKKIASSSGFLFRHEFCAIFLYLLFTKLPYSILFIETSEVNRAIRDIQAWSPYSNNNQKHCHKDVPSSVPSNFDTR